MAIIAFLLILSALVIVHELGHFGVAKLFGVRVDEFGLGYPPKAKKLFSWKGTDFTLNWLPFGGFVKIFGENYSESDRSPESFQHKNRGIQASILAAGVVFNFLFAWLLISIGLMYGMPSTQGQGLPVSDARTVITDVVAGSPASQAGLKSGDALVSISRGKESIPKPGEKLSPEEAAGFISSSVAPVTVSFERGGETSVITVAPSSGIVPRKSAIGIAMDEVGTVKLPFFRSIYSGLKLSYELTAATAQALISFIIKAVSGRADLSQVTGPVGLVSVVGSVTQLGLSYVISLIALISINLAIINLLPFPALDGGRIIMVALEAVSRKRIPAKIFNAVNAAGFAILIFLMILVTIHDVSNIL